MSRPFIENGNTEGAKTAQKYGDASRVQQPRSGHRHHHHHSGTRTKTTRYEVPGGRQLPSVRTNGRRDRESKDCARPQHLPFLFLFPQGYTPLVRVDLRPAFRTRAPSPRSLPACLRGAGPSGPVFRIASREKEIKRERRDREEAQAAGASMPLECFSHVHAGAPSARGRCSLHSANHRPTSCVFLFHYSFYLSCIFLFIRYFYYSPTIPYSSLFPVGETGYNYCYWLFVVSPPGERKLWNGNGKSTAPASFATHTVARNSATSC